MIGLGNVLASMSSPIKYVRKADSCMFPSVVGHRPIVLILGLSQVRDFLFLLKIFFRLGNFFVPCIPHSKAPFAACPAASLLNRFCMTFDFVRKNANFKFLFNLWFCVLFATCNGTISTVLLLGRI